MVARAVTTYKARAAEHLRSCQHLILKLLGENESAFQPPIQRASSSRDQHLTNPFRAHSTSKSECDVHRNNKNPAPTTTSDACTAPKISFHCLFLPDKSSKSSKPRGASPEPVRCASCVSCKLAMLNAPSWLALCICLGKSFRGICPRDILQQGLRSCQQWNIILQVCLLLPEEIQQPTKHLHQAQQPTTTLATTALTDHTPCLCNTCQHQHDQLQ